MPHKTDIPEHILQDLRTYSQNRNLLNQLVYLSRLYFGFFVKHTPRAYEYVWLIEQLPNIQGKKVLDIGTGISPLPIYLAQQGAEVYTIDFSHNQHHFGEDRSNWYEWGSLDYSSVHPNILSMHQNIHQVEFPEHHFDCIYSISVIEHMSAMNRKNLWPKIDRWLKREGDLLLSLDLIQDTEDLYPYFLDKFIEDPEVHGDLSTLRKELTERFTIRHVQSITDIPHLDQPIDIVTLSCTTMNPS
ncbi:SAM-dependent methyltransferase [Marininema halotolerans]|uniref:Methyltransferase domain-containing protein n=1 Tax=Marininema halotolerans TaxID=1155944 RepID=A0A1I6TZ76_9BACL|nr:class I SAM-dependent methyltransferase [Marininema halotolerans]SFS94480.1 Methyltransferase domain-containing protein [Marininema halotolerans]